MSRSGRQVMTSLKPGRAIALLAVFALFWNTHIAGAQDLMKLSIEELMNLKITTSAKTEQEQWRASAKIIVITEQTIKERGYQDLTQVLRDMPQFQVQSQYGHWTKGAVVNLRGHRSGNSGNNKFLILVDGLKISDDAEEGLYLGMNSIPLNSVAQIEIVYGPNSTLYGRDAYAGMVNLITRKKDFVSAGVSYGTYQSKRIYSGLYHTFDDKLSFNLFYSNYKSDEQDPTTTSVSYLNRTVYPQHPYTGRFYRASDNSMLNAGLFYKDFSLKYILYDITGSESYGGNPNLYITEYSSIARQRNQIVSFMYDTEFNKKLDLSAVYIYKKYEFDPQTANLYTRDPIDYSASRNALDSTYSVDPFYAYGGRKYYYFRTASQKMELKSVYDFSPNLKSVSGIEANYVRGIPVISEGKGGKPMTSEKQRRPYEHNFNTKSIFSEINYQYSQALFASAGARLDMNSNYASTLMPRAGLIYKIDGQLFKLMYSQGYLAPSISQNKFESITTFSWIKPNSNLKPERITSYELEWVYNQQDFKLDANIFYNHLLDGIQESVHTGDSTYVVLSGDSLFVPVLQSRNGRSGYRAGLDLGMTSSPNKYVTFQLRYSFTTGVDKKAQKDIDLADNLTSIHTVYGSVLLKYNKYSLYSGLYWASERKIRSKHLRTEYANLVDENGFDHFPAVFLADCNFRVNDIFKGFSLYLTVHNVFNTEYYGQTINAQWGSPKVLQDLRRITGGIEIDL